MNEDVNFQIPVKIKYKEYKSMFCLAFIVGFNNF